MANVKINIDRLDLRLKGVSAHGARDLSGDLGSGLLRRLAQGHKFQGGGTVKIGTVDAGVLPAGKNASGPDLQRSIADRIADTIGSHLDKNNNK
jgi:hypothetical protein